MSADVNKGCAKRKHYVPWELFFFVYFGCWRVRIRVVGLARLVSHRLLTALSREKGTCKVVGYGGIDRRRTCA